jgi:hypothetical protein
MTPGTNVICTLQIKQGRKPKVFKGQVIRVDPPQDGWDAGIMVEYPKMKYPGIPCAIFHLWPSLWVKEA